jgi:hypothetical protein
MIEEIKLLRIKEVDNNTMLFYFNRICKNSKK